MAITINGSGTITGISAGGLPDGSVTSDDIAAAAVTDAKIASGVSASKLTGTLPAIDGSALTNLPGGGKVLQVQSTQRTAGWSTTSSSFVTFQQVTITPSSTSSKILLQWNTGVSSNSSNMFGIAILKRDSTTIALGDAYASHQRGWVDIGCNQTNQYLYGLKNIHSVWLDSPSTTSPVTYYVQVRQFANSGGGNIYLGYAYNTGDGNRTTCPSSLIATEIAG